MRIFINPVERESFILLLILDSKLIPLTIRLISQRRAPLFFIQSGPDDHMSHALALVDQNRVGRSHIILMRDHHGKLIGALLDHPDVYKRQPITVTRRPTPAAIRVLTSAAAGATTIIWKP